MAPPNDPTPAAGQTVDVDDRLPKIGAPATRALADIGVTTLSQVVDLRPAELQALHGFGPRALGLLRNALAARGHSLRDDDGA